MLNVWSKLYLADCEVIKFSKDLNIYPIFKNGRSSLILHAEQNHIPILKNREITKLNEITIYIRDPIERFISGVHTFFYFNKLEFNTENLKKINNHTFIDRHFMPHAFWLFHLFKYYKNKIILKDVNEVFDLVKLREGPWYPNRSSWNPLTQEQKEKIQEINYKKFTDIDYSIIKKYMNKKIDISIIIREIKNALSSS